MGHTAQQVFVSTLVAVLCRYTVQVCSVLSNLTVGKTKCVVCVPKCSTKDHAHQML